MVGWELPTSNVDMAKVCPGTRKQSERFLIGGSVQMWGTCRGSPQPVSSPPLARLLTTCTSDTKSKTAVSIPTLSPLKSTSAKDFITKAPVCQVWSGPESSWSEARSPCLASCLPRQVPRRCTAGSSPKKSRWELVYNNQAVSTLPISRMSMSLPGVATQISAPLSRSLIWPPFGAPPNRQAVLMGRKWFCVKTQSVIQKKSLMSTLNTNMKAPEFAGTGKLCSLFLDLLGKFPVVNK